MDKLNDYRMAINTIDKKITDLITERANIAKKVGEFKADNHLPTYVPEREADILKHINGNDTLSKKALQGIFINIIAACRNLEEPLKAGYLGPEGTFSQQAVINHFGKSIAQVPFGNFYDLFLALKKKTINFAVVPVENSTEGSVSLVADLLIDTNTTICSELTVTIEHQLLSHCKNLQKITTVYAHQQSLRQCSQWLNKQLPKATLIEVSSNAQGVQQANKDNHAAAIASLYASEFYNIPALANNIQDFAGNRTRFIVLSHLKTKPTVQDKTSIVVAAGNDKSGALLNILKPLQNNGLSMTRLESRPAKDKHNWQYYFYIDFLGHCENETIAECLKAIKTHCHFYKFLGSYPTSISG